MTRAEHCRDCTEVDVVSVLPGGRNFGQKAQQGQEKTKVYLKNLWPNIAKSTPGHRGETLQEVPPQDLGRRCC